MVFSLLIAFQIKHWLADYPMQRRYMLGKFREDWGFLLPLLAHAAVHGAMTAWICAFVVGFKPVILLPALFDIVIHATMDRIKASKKYLGRFKPLTSDTAPTATDAQWKSNDHFWWSLGLDQGVHHLTHYAIIWWLVRGAP